MAATRLHELKNSPRNSFGGSTTLPRSGPIKSLSDHRNTHSLLSDYSSLPRSHSGSVSGIDRYGRHHSGGQPSPGRKFLSKINLTDDNEDVFQNYQSQSNDYAGRFIPKITFADTDEYINDRTVEQEDLVSDTRLTPQEESFLPLVTQLQSYCRGYLARKKLKRRKDRKLTIENQMKEFQENYQPFEDNHFQDSPDNFQTTVSNQHFDNFNEPSFKRKGELETVFCPNCANQPNKRNRLDSTDSDSDQVSELTLSLKKTQRDLDYYKAQVDYLMINDNEESEKLKRQLEELKTSHQNEIDELQEYLSIESKKTRNLSLEIEDLQSKLRVYSKKKDETDSKSKRWSTDIIKLETKLKEAEAMLKLSNKEKEKINAKYMILEMELNDCKEESITLNRKLGDVNNQVSSSEFNSSAQSTQLLTKVKFLEDEISRLQQICLNHEDTVEDLQQQLLESEKSHQETVDNNLHKLKNQLSREKRDAEVELEESNEKLYRQVKQLKKTIEELNAELESKEVMITDMDNQLAELTDDDTRRDDMVKHKENNEQLKKEVRYLKSKLDEKEKTLLQFQEEKTDEDSFQIRSLKRTIEDLEKQNATLSTERLQLKIKCYNLTTTIDEAESRTKLLTKEKNSLQNKLNNSKSEVRKLETAIGECEKQKGNDRIQMSTLNRKVKELNDENQEMKEEIRKLKKELSKELSSVASDFRSKPGSSLTGNSTNQSRLERRVKDLEKTKEELEEELRSEGSRYQNEISSFKLDLQEATIREENEKVKVRKLKQDLMDMEDQLERSKKVATNAERNSLDSQSELDMAKCEIAALKRKLEQHRATSSPPGLHSSFRYSNHSDEEEDETDNSLDLDSIDFNRGGKEGTLPRHRELLSQADALLSTKKSHSPTSSTPISLSRRKKFNN